MQKKVPDFQRVLILQGGGSLGAYEAGAYKALYEMVTKMDNERGFKGKPLIDIVAGTSIGAINSAVLVSYVIENNTWEGSSERLNEFWEYLSKESSLDYIPGFTYWWDFFHNKVNHDIATGEAPRRYYATKRVFGCRSAYCFLSFDASTRYKVFESSNLWYQLDSKPFRKYEKIRKISNSNNIRRESLNDSTTTSHPH